MEMILAISIFVFLLSLYFHGLRNQSVYLVKTHFINTKELYPVAFEALPSYSDMMFRTRYQHLWTKAQWVKWVKAQGVAA